MTDSICARIKEFAFFMNRRSNIASHLVCFKPNFWKSYLGQEKTAFLTLKYANFENSAPPDSHGVSTALFRFGKVSILWEFSNAFAKLCWASCKANCKDVRNVSVVIFSNSIKFSQRKKKAESEEPHFQAGLHCSQDHLAKGRTWPFSSSTA